MYFIWYLQVLDVDANKGIVVNTYVFRNYL